MKWFKRFIKSIFLIFFLIVFSSLQSFASVTESQAIKVIMGEARGEPFEGQCAVGEVLRGRNSVKGFYGYTAKFKFTPKEYQTALKAWRLSATTNYTKGATHFEGDSFKRPYWISSMIETAHIGSQTFYKERVKSHAKLLRNGSHAK